MPTIYLVRHGKAAAAFDEDLDPPLNKDGTKQALEMADTLGPLGPLPLIASPMRRCRETASALENVWGAPAKVDPRVSEVPSPTDDLKVRREWLRGFMRGTWSDPAAGDLKGWRADLIAAIEEIDEDTVISSHFVAINTVVGALNGDERVTSFQPDNCSITRLEKSGGVWKVAALGREVETDVL
ncbi:MAG: histidine phosphatase family protein [Minwuia sp.]|uniref:histidine phosphatase family protein n=1 Tax=Minwuia sp. TaxID=2493630 RepID=UPI003A8A7FAA